MLTMAVTRWRRRFHSNQRTGYPHLNLLIPTLLDPLGIPPLPTLSLQWTLPLTPLPRWLTEPTPSPTTLELHLPFLQGNDIVTMLCQLNKAGEGLSNKVLLEWALDVLHSPEDWRWLWSPEPATTSSLSPTLPSQLLPPLYDASNADPWSMYALPMPQVHLLFLLKGHSQTSSMNLSHVVLLYLWSAQSCGHQFPSHNCSSLPLSPSPHG